MKKGINYWSFKEGTSIKSAMNIAKDAGFLGFEPCLASTGEISLESTDEEVINLKRYADELHLEITSLASWLPWEFSLTSDNPRHRETAKDIVRKQLDVANLLGTDTILVVPGYVGVDFVPNSEVCSYDKVYDRALEAINELSSHAAKQRVTIAIENVWNKFLLSPLEMRDFVDKINSPFVGVYFDVGNVLLTGYPEQWIRILGKRIKRVHFKDYRLDPGGFNAFVDLLAGDVNYPAVMKALKDIDYDSYCIAEMMPTYTHYTDQVIYNTSQAMDRIFNENR